MRASKSAVMRSLRTHEAWLRRMSWEQGQRPANQNRAVNLMVGLYHVLLSCGVDIQGWLAREKTRAALRTPMLAVRSESGRGSMAELCTLALVALDARTWETDTVEVGPLYVAPRKPASDAQREGARQRMLAKYQAEREAREKRTTFEAHRHGLVSDVQS